MMKQCVEIITSVNGAAVGHKNHGLQAQEPKIPLSNIKWCRGFACSVREYAELNWLSRNNEAVTQNYPDLSWAVSCDAGAIFRRWTTLFHQNRRRQAEGLPYSAGPIAPEWSRYVNTHRLIKAADIIPISTGGDGFYALLHKYLVLVHRDEQ